MWSISPHLSTALPILSSNEFVIPAQYQVLELAAALHWAFAMYKLLTSITLGISITTAAGCTIEPEIDSFEQEALVKRLSLTETTPVVRESCSKKDTTVKFGNLTWREQEVLDGVIYTLSGGNASHQICKIYPDGAGGQCKAFGYVCWINTEQDNWYGCAKETC